jgi:transcriptional regulator with XRE-family HTH domain
MVRLVVLQVYVTDNFASAEDYLTEREYDFRMRPMLDAREATRPDSAESDLSPHQVGERLRKLRKARHLTLRFVAERAGISEAHLSQIECGHNNASIAALRRIAAALGLTMSDLFADGSDDTPRVLRAADRPALAFGVLGRKYRLTPALHRQLDVFLGEFQPGGSTGDELYGHADSEEFLLVIEGKACLQLGEDIFELSSGDSIVYHSSTPHRLTETAGRPAVILWAMTPPTY